MTNWWWRLPEIDYQSTVTVQSRLREGVTFEIARMAFNRRMQLMRQVRELARNLEFLRAGESDSEQMDAQLLNAEIERAYITWGLISVGGLVIDGEPATPASLLERGPEDLVYEAIGAVRAECSLKDEERKN